MSIYNDARSKKASAMDRIGAMVDAESTVCCYNYFARACDEVDEDARTALIHWTHTVATAMTLDEETVWISTSYLDRYMSSGKGRSEEALQDKYLFQLAAITSFYLAVKLHEHQVNLDAASLSRLCRGYYPAKDILDCEEDILFALDWRTLTPTPCDFVRELVQLLPAEQLEEQSKEALVESALKYVERATDDYYSSFYSPSTVGAACLCSALLVLGSDSDVLTTRERHSFWMTLAKCTDIIAAMEVQNKLLEGKTLCKPVVPNEDTLQASSIEVPPVETIVIENPVAERRGSWGPSCKSLLGHLKNIESSPVSTWPKMAQPPMCVCSNACPLSKSERSFRSVAVLAPLSKSERAVRSSALVSQMLSTQTARQA